MSPYGCGFSFTGLQWMTFVVQVPKRLDFFPFFKTFLLTVCFSSMYLIVQAPLPSAEFPYLQALVLFGVIQKGLQQISEF